MSINWRKILTLCLLINADVSYKELRIIFHIECIFLSAIDIQEWNEGRFPIGGKKKRKLK